MLKLKIRDRKHIYVLDDSASFSKGFLFILSTQDHPNRLLTSTGSVTWSVNLQVICTHLRRDQTAAFLEEIFPRRDGSPTTYEVHFLGKFSGQHSVT